MMTRPATTARKKETALRVILGLAVVLMLLVPFGLFLSELAQAHRQYVINTNYVPVRAMIMASSVDRYKGSKGAVHYAPSVRYRYEVSGKTYESDNLMAVYVSGDEEWAQSIVDRYQVETDATVYYDPRDPSRAVLLNRFTFSPYFYMLTLSFSLTGGAFLILNVWTQRSRSVSAKGNGWYEIPPKMAGNQRLLIAAVCTAIWYGLGAVPMAHYFVFVPGPHSSLSLRPLEIYGLLGLVPAGFLIRYISLRRGLADARLEMDRPVVFPGQAFKFSISQEARQRLVLKHARVRFRCIATKVQGKSRTHSTLYETVPVDLKDHSLHPGESLTLSGDLAPPAGQAPSGRDATGKFSRIDWSIKLECHIAHGPNYIVEYPIAVEPAPAVQPERPRDKPRAMVDVRPIEPEYAGRILSKGNLLLGYVIGLSPCLFQLAGITAMAVTFLTVFPDKSASKTVPDAERARARVWFASGAAVVAVSSVIGLAFANLLPFRFMNAVARREIGRRRDAIVSAGEDSIFVDIVPRANWNRMLLENASDIGFLEVDAKRREIRFEGDKERYRIPAEALISCELAKSVLTSTAKPEAPGYWLVVIKAWNESGVWEAPTAPRLPSSVLWGKKVRKKTAEHLQTCIKALIDRDLQKKETKEQRETPANV